MNIRITIEKNTDPLKENKGVIKHLFEYLSAYHTRQ